MAIAITRRALFERAPAAAMAVSIAPAVALASAATAPSPIGEPDGELKCIAHLIDISNAKINEIVRRMTPLEEAHFADLANKEARKALDIIQVELDAASEELTDLFAELKETRPVTLAGLKIKAKFGAEDSDVADSLVDDIISL